VEHGDRLAHGAHRTRWSGRDREPGRAAVLWHRLGVPPGIQLPLTEWVVLALLDEAPRHGFALARELQPPGPVGRVWTVSRPLTYRAVDQLVAKGMAHAARQEESDGGPKRTILTPTPTGRRQVRRWRTAPVEHLRDVRSELLVKLILLERAGVDRAPLVEAQLASFEPLFAALGDVAPSPVTADDAVALWRYETAQATRRLLQALRTT
jgi:DNA-binding PadR family transcriptional regulator